MVADAVTAPMGVECGLPLSGEFFFCHVEEKIDISFLIGANVAAIAELQNASCGLIQDET